MPQKHACPCLSRKSGKIGKNREKSGKIGKGTKTHKNLIINTLLLVEFCVFVL